MPLSHCLESSNMPMRLPELKQLYLTKSCQSKNVWMWMQHNLRIVLYNRFKKLQMRLYSYAYFISSKRIYFEQWKWRRSSSYCRFDSWSRRQKLIHHLFYLLFSRNIWTSIKAIIFGIYRLQNSQDQLLSGPRVLVFCVWLPSQSPFFYTPLRDDDSQYAIKKLNFWT